jgi:hypothetical protein
MAHIKLQILLLIILLSTECYVVMLIRRNRIELRYALVWLVMGCVLIWFTLLPQAWETLAQLFGIVEPVNMLFLFSNMVLLALVLSLIIENSKLAHRTRILAQEIALVKHSVENLS